MDSLFLLLIIALLGILGTLLWLQSKRVSRATFHEVEQEKNSLNIELAKLQERERMLLEGKGLLEKELENERRERSLVERMLEAAHANLQAQQEKDRMRQEELLQLRRQFQLEFQEIASTILEEKTEKFTAVNQTQLDLVLTPLKEKIATFEEKVERTYQREAAERNVLKGVVEQLMKQSMLIKDEANNLTKALKGDNRKQGYWGEIILERVLERSGLVKGQEYKLQAVYDEGDTRKIPDAVVLLPDDKHLVIDSKVSLTAYERWVNEEEELGQTPYLRQHVQSIETHVRQLSAKNYHSLYGIQSPDFVLLFMPVESALSVAVKEKPELFSYAWDRRVVIVGPSTLLATLRTIASVWVQERQNRNVLEIAKEAGLLYDKFVNFLNDMEQLDTHLQRAAEKHHEAMRKLSAGTGNVIKKVENLKQLGAKANKQIDSKYLE